MVLEIWSETDKIFYFGPYFYPFTTPHPRTPHPPPNDPKYQNFEKNEKNARILSFYPYMRTINEDNMIYGS